MGAFALEQPRRLLRLVVAAIALVVAFAAIPAWADYPMPAQPDPLPAPAEDGLYPMIFPVQGDHYFSDTWGACRDGCSRGHLGVDILTYGVKGVPVVAAAAGTIGWVSSTCCAISIEHDDGWKSYYIHLNNDTPGTDDGQAWGIADGLVSGSHVEAGQLIGWVGDSGNAEGVSPHLHWELWAPVDLDADNWRDRHQAINPTPHAAAADVPLPDPRPAPCADGVCDSVGLIDEGGEWTLWDGLEVGGGMDGFFFGNPGDVPFMGDWDGDGVATPGLYRQSDGFVYVRDSNSEGVADSEFFFGNPGDWPLVGDFDGDGTDSVSIYRESEARVYVVNRLGEDGGGLGAADFDFLFGNPGDVPFVGDFNGDGIDSIGLYRQSTGFAYFRDSLTTGVADFEFFYGDPGDVIMAGDWDGDGDDTVAVYRPSDGKVYVNLENAATVADYWVYVGSYANAVAWSRNEPANPGL